MQSYWRLWTYSTYFCGEQTIYAPNETAEEVIRQGLDEKWGRDNWQHNSLKRGGLVKDRKAFPRLVIAGLADCGCVYHAEDGIPCPHDLALAESGKS